jgi:hypothetical protein
MTPQARGGYFRFKAQYVDAFPVPTASDEDKDALATLAEACQSAAEERYRRQEAVRRRIPDLCAPPTTTR